MAIRTAKCPRSPAGVLIATTDSKAPFPGAFHRHELFPPASRAGPLLRRRAAIFHQIDMAEGIRVIRRLRGIDENRSYPEQLSQGPPYPMYLMSPMPPSPPDLQVTGDGSCSRRFLPGLLSTEMDRRESHGREFRFGLLRLGWHRAELLAQ